MAKRKNAVFRRISQGMEKERKRARRDGYFRAESSQNALYVEIATFR